MEQSLSAWLIPLITLVVGVAIGFFIAKLAPGVAPMQTQRKLDEIQDRFDTYQNEVVNHFSTTANLVNKLIQDQQAVQEHLANSASQLALDEQARQRLLTALHETPRARDTHPSPLSEAPRDYAPKSADQIGMLDAQFGLKK